MSDRVVASALERLACGGMVVVADESSRENEGDLVCAAEYITVDRMEFYLRHGSGIVCTPMADEWAERLDLPPMVDRNTDAQRTAFTVTVDHIDTGTGISPRDRATTVRALGHPDTTPQALRRPGHVFPLRSKAGGVLQRRGHTEAASDLVKLAALGGVGVITELVTPAGTPLNGEQSAAFARQHDLPFLQIADLVEYRRRHDPMVLRVGEAAIPTPSGVFVAHSYRCRADGLEHTVLTMGDPAAASTTAEGALVRVHSECATGDLFGSRRCDCGPQLSEAMEAIAAEGSGALVYVRGHEGRGIGLGAKLQAYRLQDAGLDTVQANVHLGLPVDAREYGIAAAILGDLGITRIRLITNNPRKCAGLADHGLHIAGRVASHPVVGPDNLAYLRAKRDLLGHCIEIPCNATVSADSDGARTSHAAGRS